MPPTIVERFGSTEKSVALMFACKRAAKRCVSSCVLRSAREKRAYRRCSSKVDTLVRPVRRADESESTSTKA